MADDQFYFSKIVTDNNDLRKTLAELRGQEAGLKNTILQIKQDAIQPFNLLEYYQDNLKSTQMLIDNIRFYLKKNSVT